MPVLLLSPTRVAEELLDLVAHEIGPWRARLALELETCCCSCTTCCCVPVIGG